MIVSASRRTDIPAFYADWFMRRVRAGYALVAHPMRPRSTYRVSLAPEEVTAIVFWTRSPRALMRWLPELDARGFRYYFQFTICGYGPPVDGNSPSATAAVDTFRRLAGSLGPERVIWRYDPILFSAHMTPSFHRQRFESLAGMLQGETRRCVVSVWDDYRKLALRLQRLAAQGVRLRQPTREELDWLMPDLADIAKSQGMEITSCAEELDLVPYGVVPGRCIDPELLRKIFGVDTPAGKDPSQRPACGCARSRDIGAYNSCLFECAYCYATTNFDVARYRRRQHDPTAPSLLQETRVAEGLQRGGDAGRPA